MPDITLPFSVQVSEDGTIPEAELVQTRRLSDMQGLYNDAEAAAALAASDPVIYRVYLARDIPPVEGQLAYSTTVIEPGTVGNEFFMTKGHYHAKGSRGELYYGLSGEGLLLMQTETGVKSLAMRAGTGAYVAPYWGHRTINTGSTPFVFLAVYPADAGYNYQAIAERGFAQLVVRQDNKVAFIDNPAWVS